MITFETKTRRDPEVSAWSVSVSALYHLCEDADYGESFHAAYEDLPLVMDGTGAPIGVCIAKLSALMVDCQIFYQDELIEFLEAHTEIGSTFDICGDAAQTAQSLLHWSHGDEAWELCEEFGSLNRIIVTKYLEADAYVDRGAILGYMLPHLTALGSGQLLVAHEEHVEEMLPPDQKGRIIERMSTLNAIANRFKMEVVNVDHGAESEGRAIEHTQNTLGETQAAARELPFVVISIPHDGYDDVDWEIFDPDQELEVMDMADWAEARMGVRPQLAEALAMS